MTMNPSTMSVARALAERKRVQEELNKVLADMSDKSTGNPVFLYLTQGQDSQQKPFKSTFTETELKAVCQSNYDSIFSKIDRLRKLKEAIVAFNASNTVMIAGQSMTIAAAIELKANVAIKKTVLERMKKDVVLSSDVVQKANAATEEEIKRVVAQLYPPKPTIQETAEEIEARTKAMENYRASVLKEKILEVQDPLKVSELIKKLEEEIREIEIDLDFKLNEVNNTNTITIEG